MQEQEVQVLIVPLWNWNEESFVSAIQKGGSNCTFMELKFPDDPIKSDKLSSNCTFMELKYGIVVNVPMEDYLF